MSVHGSSKGGEEVLVRPPAHPVPSLQGPFEESMVESVSEASEFDTPMDAITRRSLLLDSAFYQRIVAGRWKQKPGEKYHPLWKLVAQMSFGLHLLARNMAKSEDEVMKILQAHVDDIDGFLERTSEDFDLAQSDMHERLRCLKLPLQHGEVFDRMLEDPSFRGSILDGNEKIEHIVHRTKRFLKDSLKDVQKGFDATNVLEKYLQGLTKTWQRQTPEHEAVFVAMLGNVEGWRKAFMELHLQGNKLAGTLKKLTEIVNEMARRANIVSQNLVARARLLSHPGGQSISSRSQMGSMRASQIHKPLPTAPGQKQSSRQSSKSTKHLEDSSRPVSLSKSGQDRSSGSSPHSHISPETANARNTPTPLSTTLLGSGTASRAETPIIGLIPALNIDEQTVSQDDLAVELPADVPEEVMRNAPVSVRNRLSYTLGLKAKDNTDHRISSVYYPKALGALLKVPQSPNQSINPISPAGRAVAVRSMTPLTPSDGDYFSAHERSPSLGRITPDARQSLTAQVTPGEGAVGRTMVRSPTLVQDNAQRQSSMLSPGLTSHPSVMSMAIPPAELPALTGPGLVETPSRPQSRLRKQSESSLGEPGPEVADTESDAETPRHEDAEVTAPPVLKIDAPPAPDKAQTTEAEVQFDEASDTATPKGAEVHELAKSQDPENLVVKTETAHTDVSNDDRREPNRHEQPSREEPEPQQSNPNAPVVAPKEERVTEAIGLKRSPTERIAQKNEETTKNIIAELEAIVPQKPSTKVPVSPIELEAPLQHFRLPPRTAASAKTFGKDYPSATIKHRADFFKLPSEQEVKPGLKPKDFNRNSKQPEPIRPLRLKLTRLDGKMVPVQVHTPQPGQEEKLQASTLNIDVITNMIEQISTTPVGSPIHDRPLSVASSNSAQIRSERTSSQFGPPGSAPTPPAPGGRPMVNPDYATAGEFEGERRQPKRSSGGSRSGLKELLNGSNSRRNSGEVSSKTMGHSSARQSVSARGSGSDMLTSAGKDVLWFKGDAKSPVGVAST